MIVSGSSLIEAAMVLRPTGSTTIFLDDGTQDAAIDIVQAEDVHIQQIEGLLGNRTVDDTAGAHLGVIAHPAQQAQGNARCAAAAAGDLIHAVRLDLHTQHAGSPAHDSLHGRLIVVIQAVDSAKTRP